MTRWTALYGLRHLHPALFKDSLSNSFVTCFRMSFLIARIDPRKAATFACRYLASLIPPVCIFTSRT